MAFKFKNGVRPDDHKYTAQSAVQLLPPPETVAIPLTQHVGVMCRPVVRVGERVFKGQLVGEIPGGLGCPVHSSVSGTVKRIEEFTTENGGSSYKIVIENDGEGILAQTVRPFGKKLSEATFDEIVSVIRNAGIVGMGGTALPTHARLSAARGKVDRLIISCLEPEPFSCSTHRLVMENGGEIIGGTKILMMALGVKEACIAVGDRSREEIKEMTALIGQSQLISLEKVSSKYPADNERSLIHQLTGIAVPAGKAPTESGCIVFTADTAYAVYEAFSKGMPLCERVVTVDGDCVSSPANFLVPVGTPVEHVLKYAGELCRQPKKIIFGGPMQGHAIWDMNAPVTKSTKAVLVLSDFFDRESKGTPPVCLRCGRCVDACPMGLAPIKIAEKYNRRNIDACEKLSADSCIECGSCSFVCPGGVAVAQLATAAKAAVLEKRRKAVIHGNGD